VRLGTTAFSFTNEWLTRRYTLEQLFRRVAELDLGPGVEVIGFQAWRAYPALPREEVLAFRRLVDELGLEPAALGAYVDVACRPDRPLTTAEAIEFLRPQIAVGSALGFPLLRLHGGIPTAVIEELTPVAERACVTLATEVQGGQAPDDPALVALLECHERLDSSSVGLVLDFSVAMTSVPKAFCDSVLGLGMGRGQLEALVDVWRLGSPRDLHAALAALDAPPAAIDEARAGFVRFGRQEPGAWLQLAPQIAYAHAKFWELDEAGEEPTVRTAELVDVLRAGGHDGVVASEWGGNAWLDVEDVDAFQLVGRHHALVSDLVSTPVLPVS
jgi:hypothetical protein